MSIQHPCLTCRLPECDDGNRACPLRRAYNASQRALKEGNQTEDHRKLASLAWCEFHEPSVRARKGLGQRDIVRDAERVERWSERRAA